MRIRGAKNLGGGKLLSAYGGDGCAAFCRQSGAVVRRSENGSAAVGYAETYCRTAAGSVTLKGGVPVYG